MSANSLEYGCPTRQFVLDFLFRNRELLFILFKTSLLLLSMIMMLTLFIHYVQTDPIDIIGLSDSQARVTLFVNIFTQAVVVVADILHFILI